MIRRAALLLALVSAPAFAQSSNTTCSRFGNQVNCNTQTQPDIWGNFQRQQEAQAAQRQQQQQMFGSKDYRVETLPPQGVAKALAQGC